MRLLKTGLLVLSFCLAAGCTISAPGVKIKAPLYGADLEIDAGHGGGGGFCPPGQAKKGNC